MTVIGLTIIALVFAGYPFHRRAVARDLAPVVPIGGRG